MIQETEIEGALKLIPEPVFAADCQPDSFSYHIGSA
jgi:hypothetical protein